MLRRAGAAGLLLAALVALSRCAPEQEVPDGSAVPATGSVSPGLEAPLRDALAAEKDVPAARVDAAISAFQAAIAEAGQTGTPTERLPGPVLGSALNAMLATLAEHPAAQAAALHAAATSLQGVGRFADAVSLEESALAARRKLLGDDAPATLASLSNLGSALTSADRLDEALPILREAVERDRRVLGADDPQTLGALNSLAAVLWRKGNLDEAQSLLREALDGCRRVFGEDHAFTLSTANNLGVLLTEAGRREEALVFCREALEGRRRTLGDDHILTLQSMDSVVQALRATHRLDEAIGQARELLDHGTRALGEDHPQTLLWTTTLGTLQLDNRQPGNALEVLQPAEAAARRALAEREPRRLGIFLAALGLARARTGDFPGASAALDDAWILLGDPAVGSTSDLTYVLANRVELEDAWEVAEPGTGHAEAAASWREELEALRG